MNKISLSNLIIVVLILLIVALLYWKLKLHSSAEIRNLTRFNETLDIEANTFLTYGYLPAELQLVDPVTKDYVNITDKYAKPTLIYRQPLVSCSTCIEDRLSVFLEMVKEIEIDFALIFGEIELRELQILRQMTQYKGDVFSCETIIEDFDEQNIPYVILYIDNSLRYTYIPNLSFPDRLQIYLSKIETMIANSKEENEN